MRTMPSEEKTPRMWRGWFAAALARFKRRRSEAEILEDAARDRERALRFAEMERRREMDVRRGACGE